MPLTTVDESLDYIKGTIFYRQTSTTLIPICMPAIDLSYAFLDIEKVNYHMKKTKPSITNRRCSTVNNKSVVTCLLHNP